MDRRFSRYVVAVALLAAPILVWLAIRAQTHSDDINNWIDRASTPFADYLTYTQRFGSDDEIVVSWQGCFTDDPRLTRAVTALRSQGGPWLDRVISGSEALTALRQSASGFGESSSRRRLRGSLFGDDLQTTCLIVRLNGPGRSRLDQSVRDLLGTLESATGLDQREIHLAGKAITDHALTDLTNQSLWWGIPGALLAALIAWCCIRDTTLTLQMMGVSALAGVTSLALVEICGIKVNGLLVLMPVLVFVLTLGCAVHMVRSLQRHLTEAPGGSPLAAMEPALRQSLPPVILSMVTTAIGIGSLGFSSLPAVFQLGSLSAVSLLLALAMLVYLLPAMWVCLGTGRNSASRPLARQRVPQLLIQLNQWPGLVLLGFAAAIVPALIGFSRFDTDLNTRNLFASSTKLVQDAAWIEENLYPLGRVDIVVSFPADMQINRFQQLRWIQQIQTAFRQETSYHAAISAANLIRVPVSNTPLQKHLTQQLIATQIDHDYDTLNREGMLHSDASADRWRITVACRLDDDHDERLLADRLLLLAGAALVSQPVSPDPLSSDSPLVLSDEVPETSPIGLQATGLGVLSAQAQRQLFADLARGLVTALLLVTPLIMLTLRSAGLGLLAILPNVFPILMVFGYYGLAGFKLDSGAILTASVGLGIAIDDTVHFLHYYRLHRELDPAGSCGRTERRNAVAWALQRCASPVLITSLIICCGLCFFSLSPFLPVRNFAICMMLMMLSAALADLLLLPALLVHPWFNGRQTRGIKGMGT